MLNHKKAGGGGRPFIFVFLKIQVCHLVLRLMLFLLVPFRARKDVEMGPKPSKRKKSKIFSDDVGPWVSAKKRGGGGGKAPKSAPNYDVTIGFLKLSIRTFRKSTSGGPLDVQFSRLLDQSKFATLEQNHEN